MSMSPTLLSCELEELVQGLAVCRIGMVRLEDRGRWRVVATAGGNRAGGHCASAEIDDRDLLESNVLREAVRRVGDEVLALVVEGAVALAPWRMKEECCG